MDWNKRRRKWVVRFVSKRNDPWSKCWGGIWFVTPHRG